MGALHKITDKSWRETELTFMVGFDPTCRCNCGCGMPEAVTRHDVTIGADMHPAAVLLAVRTLLKGVLAQATKYANERLTLAERDLFLHLLVALEKDSTAAAHEKKEG